MALRKSVDWQHTTHSGLLAMIQGMRWVAHYGGHGLLFCAARLERLEAKLKTDQPLPRRTKRR